MPRDLWDGLLELLAPPSCSACDAPLRERSEGFCGACAPLLEPLPPAPLAALDRAGFAYGGPLADAIMRLKYRGASHVAGSLAGLLHKEVRALAGKVDLVTVVPLHPRRLRERGYNQSALLAKPVARSLGVPFRPGLLWRVRETAAQVRSSPEQRRQQLQGTFMASARARERSVLVVDDVRTTGASLAEARRALEEAHAGRVFTLVVALRVFEPG
jgi:ComF family protein